LHFNKLHLIFLPKTPQKDNEIQHTTRLGVHGLNFSSDPSTGLDCTEALLTATASQTQILYNLR